MIYRAEYTREPLAPDLPGDFDHYFQAPRYRVLHHGRTVRLTDATLTHVLHYGRANGASAVKVYAVDLGRVGYPDANCYGVNEVGSQTLVLDTFPLHTPEQMRQLLAGES